MKKVILVLAVLSVSLGNSQSLKELIKGYEKYSSEIVQDTIKQHGSIIQTFKRVNKSKGLWGIKLDTIWDKADCPEYKIQGTYFHPMDNNFIIYGGEINTLTTTGFISGTEKGEKRTRSVSRDYICDCKRQKVEPFSEDFWKWIKDKK